MRLPKPQRATTAAAVSAALLVGAGGGVAVVTVLDSDETDRQETASQVAQPVASSTSTVGAIYKRAAASVVEITVGSAGEATPFGGGGGSRSQGSGFVYDDQGRVITNQHVVADADSISVKLSNCSTYDATVVGSDPSTDLAVLDVDAPAAVLKPLSLGNSGAVEVGDGVIAIGSPFGLDQTVTTGIVSALDREITSPNGFAIDNALQTDAAINHGNSGGPLLDLSGRVIGVNSQIKSESGGNDDVGFAVPSDTVAKIAAQLIESGKVEHAYLGVGLGDSTNGEGARIAEVRSGTPAASAGLRAGDIVTEIDGNAVGDSDDLRRLIDARRPGDPVELTLVRDGDERTVEVELTARPSA